MIKVFSGEDYTKRKEAQKDYISSLKDDGEVSFVVSEDTENSILNIDRFLDGGGMFIQRVCVVFQDVFSSKEVFSKIQSDISKIKESETVYLFIENNSLSKDEIKFLESNKIDFTEFNLKDKKEYNSFVLTDAVLQKKKKDIWIELNKVFSTGESGEATHGLLWWQIKSMFLVSSGFSQEDLGMKDYPYKKTKKSVSLFELQELKKIIREFALLPVSSRRKGLSLYESMEAFFLKRF